MNDINEEEKMSFCLVQAHVNGKWIPMGIAPSKASNNDFDSAGALSKELCEMGRITCIVPTEAWSFVTVDTQFSPIKITPFTKGGKTISQIEEQYAALLAKP